MPIKNAQPYFKENKPKKHCSICQLGIKTYAANEAAINRKNVHLHGLKMAKMKNFEDFPAYACICGIFSNNNVNGTYIISNDPTSKLQCSDAANNMF